MATEAMGYAPEGSCAGCHAAQHEAWQDSDHGWAMREATAGNVLGNFAGARFEDGPVKAVFGRDGERFVATLEGPEEPAQSYEIAYTFGFYPLQQYLVELPGGRLQSLTIAWDARSKAEGGQRWFSLYPGQAFTPDDALHWRGRYQNWNAMCADCHSTNLQRHYDATTDTFATTWHELNVGCQSCHGPGQGHIDWAAQQAKAADGDSAITPNNGLAVNLSSLSGPQLVEQCARCHSRRQTLGVGPQPGAPLLDSVLPALLKQGMYHADGQIQGEVYVYGSFVQSRMHQAGVSCTDCHDPHTNKLRVTGNELCTQCHNLSPPVRFSSLKPADYDGPGHHHHAPGSEGARCVNCHMPATTYMVVDPRRDHSLRVPRPDLAEQTQSPDACTRCHEGMSPREAAQSITKWFGERPRAPHHGEVLAAARQGDPSAPSALIKLIGDDSVPEIVRATAVSELRSFGAQGLPILASALDSGSALVRASSAPAFAEAPLQLQLEHLLPLLDDPRLAVRDEALKALAGIPLQALPKTRRGAYVEAMADYERRLYESADLPGNRLNLAVVLGRSGREDDAIEHYQAALGMDPYFLPARSNLATLFSQRGEVDRAQQVLQEGVSLSEAPPADRGHLAYLLALVQVEQGDAAAALHWLEKASVWRPGHVRTYYNRALLLDRVGRKDEAVAAIEEGLARAPNSADLLDVAVYLHLGSGDVAQALDAVSRLRAVRPNDPQLIQLERKLRGSP
ncbi:tetratricopeptide repeat protein [Motiliproteus sp. SC1-56]|uniref:tetratricopeptide repeat protein n=1 Tax=Motiliproteus sp. SC1-56 TaxID=2799565 RepID=UPI001A8EB5B0|nr:tetratricopeptide repeat protein [Motiliproteus sp. SC1-56]